jgi:hypothetical protein
LRGGNNGANSPSSACDKEVFGFLQQAGLMHHASTFAREKIRAHNIPELGKDDLEELGLSQKEADDFLSRAKKVLSPKQARCDQQAESQASGSASGEFLFFLARISFLLRSIWKSHALKSPVSSISISSVTRITAAWEKSRKCSTVHFPDSYNNDRSPCIPLSDLGRRTLLRVTLYLHLRSKIVT